MLRWQHKHSADLPRWRKLQDAGEDVPPAFYEQPDVWPQAGFYWQAFTDLSADRAIGMGLGPIPFRSIVQYAGLHEFHDIDEFEKLRQIVGEVDAAYLAMNSKNDQDDKMRSLVPINDAKGVGALLDRLGK